MELKMNEYEKELAHRKKKRMLMRQRQVRRQKMMLAAAAAVLVIGGIATGRAISHNKKAAREAAETAALAKEKKAQQEQRQKELEENTIRLVAVGDNLIHESIYQSTDTSQPLWNYDHLYAQVKEDISSADLAAVNQECIFVQEHENVSSYPAFGSPCEIGDALVNAGFDIVEQASNHTFDKGTEGILQTLDYWETRHPDEYVLGIHDSQEDTDQITTVTCKGVTFSLLNYTSTINGENFEGFPPYMIDLLRTEKVTKDVAKAKEAGDMVIAFLHAGKEYSTEPNQDLKNFLQLLLQQGVDIAICSHPHVLQNFETLTDDQGNEMLVYYSLGNFISTQKEPECLLGGMADITITKDFSTGKPSISDARLIPLVTHYNHEKKEYAVYKLEDYTEELAAEHSIHQETAEPFTLETLNAMYQDVLSADYQ